ncbi:MAG: hypothetical protein A2583_00595 [Bdellovibrionales bacterium RIFOXYD1_FULL_53_11]|nr:MAG: hypothetical protein A2583_00595 [Bdellovibrionales bacterium RIFOXYD1_FULL_53_11]
MKLSALTLLATVPPLLVIEGFFAGSEIALLSADKLKLKSDARRGSKRARIALELANHPERIFATTLLMTCLCMIGISALTTLFVISRLGGHADLAAVAIASPLVVVFGELIPKTIYRMNADRLAPWIAAPVNITYWIFYPFTRIISAYTSRLGSLLGPIGEMIAGKKRDMREELQQLLGQAKRDSDIHPAEKRMIKRIFDFKDTEAKHALIPLIRVDAMEDTATVAAALEKFRMHRHSRMPVFSGRIDNIIGVIELADLFGLTDMSQPIHSYISPAHYAAETQTLEDLLTDMRRENDEMVVVVDEYGGAIGILTFEDIVEEIVGEISDEYDAETASFKPAGESAWLVQARMEIKQINEQLQLELPEGDYETLGGFLLQQFGRIPEPGYELYYDTAAGSIKFVIRKAGERAIESVFVEITPKKPND